MRSTRDPRALIDARLNYIDRNNEVPEVPEAKNATALPPAVFHYSSEGAYSLSSQWARKRISVSSDTFGGSEPVYKVRARNRSYKVPLYGKTK